MVGMVADGSGKGQFRVLYHVAYDDGAKYRRLLTADEFYLLRTHHTAERWSW